MISVLYVDDERDLLELAKMFLEQSPEFQVDILTSAPEALKSARLTAYDAIISDYQMPEMDGIGFLKEVRSRYGGIPFILFTGRGREEVVIEAINHGADFYLQKGGDVISQFAELSHKIRQAVARRQAEALRFETEKRLADIIDFLPDATFAIDRDGRIIAWNRAIEEMTGRPAAEMLGKGDYEYALPFYGKRRPILIDLVFKSDEEIVPFYRKLSREGKSITAETDLPHPKGFQITVLAKATPLYNKEGVLTGAIESIRDITEWNRAQDELKAAYEQITASEEELREQVDALTASEQRVKESAARLRYMLGFYERAGGDEKALMDYAVEGAGFITGSPLGYLAFLNADESELTMYAWSKSAMEECKLRDKPIVYQTEKTGLWGEAVRQRKAVITNDYAAPNPAKKGYPKGHPEILRHMNVPVIDDGRIVIVAGVANKPEDYTDEDIRQLSVLMQGLWQVIKQRKTKEALADSEEKYRELFENSVIGIFRTTPVGRFSALNRTFARIAGYESPQQMMDAIQDIRSQLYVCPEERDRFMDALVTDGFVKDFQAQYYHRDGHPVWILINATTVRDADGAVRYYEGTIEDITERRNAEEALKRKTDELDLFFTTSLDLLCIAEPDGYFKKLNPEWERVLGYTIAELERCRFLDLVHPDDLQATLDVVSRLDRQEEILNFTNRYRHKDGTYRWIEWRSHPVGNLIFAAARDVTARKEAERELLFLKESIEHTTDEVFWLDFTGTILYVNDSACRVTGYPRNELIGIKIFALDPDFPPEVWEKSVSDLRQNKTQFFITRHRRKDGTIIDVEILAVYVNLDGCEYSFAFVRDITGRKRAEETLRRSEQKYRTILETIQDVYYRADTDGNIVLASPSILPLFGYDSIDEIIGMNLARDLWMYPDQRMLFLEQIKKNGSVTNYEAVIRRKDGKPLTIATSSHFFYDEAGNIAGIEGILHDVTLVREAEQQAQVLAGLMEITPASITVHDADGRFLYANQKTLDLHGYSREEFMALNLHQVDVLASEVLINERISLLRKNGEVSFEVEHFRKDGSTFPLHVTIRSVRWENTDAILSLAVDITEQKRSEEALRESEERFELAISGADLGTWNWNIVTGDVFFNDRWAEMLGYHLSEIEPNISSWERLLHPDDIPRVQEILNAHLEGKTASYECEHRLRHKNGSWVWVLDKGRVIERTGEGRPLFAAGTHLDITQRKLAEESLRENEERYRNFIENSSEGIFRIDFSQPIRIDEPRDCLIDVITGTAIVGEVNAALATMYGLKPADMIGRPVRDFAPDCGTQIADLLRTPQYRIIEREEQEVSGTGEPVFIVESYIGIVEDGQLLRVWGVQRSVTDRKNAEIALRESEERFRRIADNALDTIYRRSLPDGKYEYISAAATTMFGYAPAEFYADPGITPRLIHPDWQDYFRKQWSKMLEGDVPPTYEYQIIDRSGRMHWLNQRNVLVRDSYGKPVALEGIVTDITERKATERALNEIDALYRSIVENSHDIIYTVGPDGIMTFISPSWTAHLGHSPEDVVGKSYRQVVLPEDLPRCEEFFRETITSGKAQPPIEFRVYHKNGQIHWYRTTLKPVFDEKGITISLVGNAMDFTDYRKAEEALRESERRYRSIIENIQDGFVRSNREGRIVMASPSTSRMLGYSHPDDILGRPISMFYKNPEIRQTLITRLEKEGKLIDQLVELKRRDGTIFWCSVSAQITYDEKGKPSGVEGVFHDVTSYRAMETAIREANRKLSLLNSITRHDVVNQLTAMNGYIQIASLIKGDPIIHDYITKIGGVADTITRQIEFTRTYQELAAKVPSWFRLETIVNVAEVRVPVRFSGSCRGVEIFADPMLEKVFFNLFDNAVRHGIKVTEIIVRCEREPDGVIVIVEDDGIGVPQTEKEKIFDRGYGKHTGLGLFLAKEILAITGITIRETGISGRGARFEIQVPKESIRFIA